MKGNDLKKFGGKREFLASILVPRIYPFAFVLRPHCIKDAKSNMIAVMLVCENDKSNGLKSQPRLEP